MTVVVAFNSLHVAFISNMAVWPVFSGRRAAVTITSPIQESGLIRLPSLSHFP